mmetsp:Transcript_6368/g.9461  ORF Transcript_6368/g.9461 Transcript_6368/m.9461 type:complete len:102 (-) Transcript_6368:8-313(-)
MAKSQENLSTGRWSKQEKKLFESLFKKHGKKWKLISQKIGTRSPTQVKSHAQKYLLKKGNLATESEQPEVCEEKYVSSLLYAEYYKAIAKCQAKLINNLKQ